MATFFLSPIPDMTWHASWAGTEFCGECLVGARDAADARRVAAVHFRKEATCPEFGEPWLREDLVTVRELGPESNVGLFNGTVIEITGRHTQALEEEPRQSALH